MKNRVTVQELKNTIKVAKHTNSKECFSAKLTNDKRDISIMVEYYPKKDISQDIYPYWVIKMDEEGITENTFLSGNELTHVRDIYNGFVNQGNSSFLETWNKEKKFSY